MAGEIMKNQRIHTKFDIQEFCLKFYADSMENRRFSYKIPQLSALEEQIGGPNHLTN